MSLDSEVPPSKYLSVESRENTKLLKNLVKKSANHSSGSSTSNKIKSMSNKVQNCQDCVAELSLTVDKKVQGIEEKYAAELKATREEFDKRLLIVTTSITTPDVAADKVKAVEVDVAIKELYKKMTYIEAIVLNLSKSFYDVDDAELKTLIDKTVSATASATASATRPVAITREVDPVSVGGANSQGNSFNVSYSI